jgi:hypothetical protein
MITASRKCSWRRKGLFGRVWSTIFTVFHCNTMQTHYVSQSVFSSFPMTFECRSTVHVGLNPQRIRTVVIHDGHFWVARSASVSSSTYGCMSSMPRPDGTPSEKERNGPSLRSPSGILRKNHHNLAQYSMRTESWLLVEETRYSPVVSSAAASSAVAGNA